MLGIRMREDTLKVGTLSGRVLELPATRNETTTGEVRLMVAVELDVPARRVRLVSASGHVLGDAGVVSGHSTAVENGAAQLIAIIIPIAPCVLDEKLAALVGLIGFQEDAEAAAQSVRFVNLSFSFLGVLPDNFGALCDLQFLNLTANELCDLPESFWSLSSLRRLDLSFNRLSALSQNLGKLNSLELLDLECNGLCALPESCGLLSALEDLSLSRNSLTRLPDTIGELQRIRYLDLSFNRLEALPANVEQLTSLVILRLRHNRLTTLPDGLAHLPILRDFSIDHNPLRVFPTTALRNVLPSMQLPWRLRLQATSVLHQTMPCFACLGDSLRGLAVVVW